MPGIAGIISKIPLERKEKELRLMVDCMMHEPTYSSGTYFNDNLGIYTGWVCHKGSFSDCMPIFNNRKDMVLLFSGENFADKKVIDQLKRCGHEFDDSNASYLIHLYDEEGEKFLQRLNGWFSGVLVDLRESKLILFNDRYGMERVYWHENKDAFFFSSEAKSLLRIRQELRQIDMESLGEFFMYDCVLRNRTLFSNVFLLPGGSAWTFSNGNSVKKDYYFKPSDWENQAVLEKDVFYKNFRDTFINILPRYFRSENPIAMSLTAGLDTRMIMSCMDIPHGSLPCYTFGGIYRDTFDICFARKVADVCHQTHLVLRLGMEFFSYFPNLAERTIYISDGCLDVYGSSEIYFNRIAREVAPIRMTGKFGSEVIRNRTMFKSNSFYKGIFHPDFSKYIQEAVTTYTEICKGHRLSFAVFKEMPWHEFGHLAIERSQLTLRTPYMDNDLVRLMYQAPANTRVTNKIQLRLIEEYNPALRRIRTNRGTAGKSNYLYSKCVQLFYYSILKAEYIYLFQLPHWLAKLDYTFAPLHPERLIVGRQKFEHYRIWFRNELSDYVREILLDNRTSTRPYLNKKLIEEMVNNHIKGNRNYFNEINKVLTVELIHRILID